MQKTNEKNLSRVADWPCPSRISRGPLEIEEMERKMKDHNLATTTVGQARARGQICFLEV